MRRQTLWRMLLTAAFLALVPWVAQAVMTQKLLVPNGAASESFGYPVSLSADGGTALIGAGGDNDKGDGSGAAHIFTRAADGIWVYQAKLTAADGSAWDAFGYDVSLSLNGDTALIGAAWDDNKGSAYVFARAVDGSWIQQAKLTATDGVLSNMFGRPVSLSADGNTAMIGATYASDKGYASGAAYVFTRAADGSWTQQAKLTATDGAVQEAFGWAVSLSADGRTALIGACNDDNKGAAYVFTRAADGSWIQQAKLTADDGADSDSFGRSVNLSADGSTALIGASNMLKGSAYVFTRTINGTWAQQAKLIADDGIDWDYYGSSISLSADGSNAIIGACNNDNGKGAAYFFTRTTNGTWVQQAKLIADDGIDSDYFGSSVALSANGSLSIIGAYGDDDNGNGAGSVYVFSLNNAPVANAGSNQSAVQGDTICFDGSGSTDADNDPLSYLWTLDAWPAGSSAMLDNPTAEKPCITADLPGTYQVSLIVNDGTVDSAPSTAEAVAISCQDVAREAVKAVNALDPSVFDNQNNQKNLIKGIFEVIALVDQQLYAEALLKLEGGSVLGKTKGCAIAGAPDNDDWIKDCASQAQVYPLLQQTMVCVQRL